jgi:hypothetical protein
VEGLVWRFGFQHTLFATIIAPRYCVLRGRIQGDRNTITKTAAAYGTDRRLNMINLHQLGIGGIVFLIGAVIYIINLLYALGKHTKAIPIDGIGLMVLGIGLALLLKL